MKKFLLFSCLLLSICAICRAQFYERQLISPAGDYFAGSSVQITWVLGDLVTGAYDIGQLIIPYGVGVPDYDGNTPRIALFPNPTSDEVYVHLNMENIENCTYYLFDILGRELQNGNISSYQTELSFAPFESGLYILRIIKENALIEEFKIIKQ